MRIASFNLENLFDRAKALNQETWDEGRPTLERFRELATLLEEPVYDSATKARLSRLIVELGMEKSDTGPFVILRRNRGHLVKRKKTGEIEIVAGGRNDWIGWVELRTEPVNEKAIVNTGRVIGDDFDLAQAGATPLAYEPHHTQAQSLRQAQPAVYWQQGVPRGILDNAIESLLVRESGAAPRVMSFLEFAHARTEQDGPMRNAFERIGYLVADFHPRTRPVFWRVLLATAGIYRALIRVADRNTHDIASLHAAQLLATVDAERDSFDWRADKHDADDSRAIEHAHAAVAAYLKQSVAPTVARDLAAMARQATQGDRGR